MMKKIIITENQYSKLLMKINEQEGINPLFKSSYNADDKSIEASYFLFAERPNSYVIVNPKEFINKNIEWADGSIDYRLGFDILELPKSQVQIVGEIDSFPNFKIFKIPYWLFKKEPKLEIKRFEGKKRPTLQGKNELLRSISDLGIVDAFEPLGGDFKKIKTLVDRVKNPILPKKPDPSVYIKGPDQDGKSYGEK